MYVAFVKLAWFGSNPLLVDQGLFSRLHVFWRQLDMAACKITTGLLQNVLYEPAITVVTWLIPYPVAKVCIHEAIERHRKMNETEPGNSNPANNRPGQGLSPVDGVDPQQDRN